ncbi:MAG: hypothetical protein HDT39_11435 [Lachnospiraceae bacterium]|nr:hypothetical protein [Lachnospiraceae bacterium]
MGLFSKLKNKKVHNKSHFTSEPISAPVTNTGATVLFNKPTIDVKEFETAITKKFGAKSIIKIDNSHPSVTHLTLHIDNIDVICSYMPFALPQEEWDIQELLSINHYISKDEQKSFVEHKSFCLITEIGGGKTLEGKRSVCIALTKLCGVLLMMESAAGVYVSAANLLIGKKMYLNHVSITEQQTGNAEYFPTILWILVYPAYTDDGASTIETYGLEQFGFLELVFYNPKEEWSQSYEKLYIMSTLQITGKEIYKNMDTISFSNDDISIFKQNGKKLNVIGGI